MISLGGSEERVGGWGISLWDAIVEVRNCLLSITWF